MIVYAEVSQSLILSHPFITATILGVIALGLMWVANRGRE